MEPNKKEYTPEQIAKFKSWREKILESRRNIPAWNKGKKLSPEHKEKISQSLKGREPWNKGKKGVMPEPWNKGMKWSEMPLAQAVVLVLVEVELEVEVEVLEEVVEVEVEVVVELVKSDPCWE